MNAEYQLYVSNNCDGCTKIMTAIEEQNIVVTTVNIDFDGVDLPFTPLILPALVKKNKVVGYGFKDIIALLNQKH